MAGRSPIENRPAAPLVMKTPTSTPSYKHTAEVPERIVNIYCNALALAAFIKQGETFAINAAAGVLAIGNDPFCLPNRLPGLFAQCDSAEAQRVAAAKSLLTTLETSPEYREAAEILTPLLKAEREAAAKVEAAQIAAAEAEARLRAELAEATARAAKEAEAHPAVIAAKAGLEKARAAIKSLLP